MGGGNTGVFDPPKIGGVGGGGGHAPGSGGHVLGYIYMVLYWTMGPKLVLYQRPHGFHLAASPSLSFPTGPTPIGTPLPLEFLLELNQLWLSPRAAGHKDGVWLLYTGCPGEQDVADTPN